MQTVIDDILVNYDTSGSKSNPDLVILHGWGRNSKDWASVAQFLSKDYCVYSLDLPGFGASSFNLSTAWNTYDYASFVEKFIKKIEIEKPVLIGHSLGGRIGIVLASQKSDLSKLVLVDSAGIEEQSWNIKFRIAIFKLLKVFLPNFLVAKIRKNMSSSDYLQAGQLRETLSKVVKDNLKHLLPNINAPTLIIWGEKDDNQDVQLAKYLKCNIKNSKLRIVWEAGHHPHLEQPKDFQNILKEEL